MKDAVNFTQGIAASGIRIGSLQYNPRNVKDFTIVALTTPDLELYGAIVARIAGPANGVISGIAAPSSEWKRIILLNNSANHLTLSDADAASAANNRFDMGGNFVLQSKRAVELLYDQTAKKWKVFGNEATFAS